MRRAVGIAGVVIIAVALVACVGAAFALASNAPHGGMHLVGISIGGPGNAARIPRRALTCTDGPAAREETCIAIVAGEPLRVAVRYETPRAFMYEACQATYRGASEPCRATNYTLGGGIPRYAGMDGTTLGIAPEEIATIRARYPLDNLYEAEWLALVPRVAIGFALVLAFGVALVPWPRWYTRAIAAGAVGLLAYVATAGVFRAILGITGIID